MPLSHMLKIRTTFPDITCFSNIVEIQVLWVIFSGEYEGSCLYRGEPESIEWIKASKILRFNARCLEGGDNDVEISLQFTKGKIVLRYDLEEFPECVPMTWFEGPSGLLLDSRTQTQFLSVLIKPA